MSWYSDYSKSLFLRILGFFICLYFKAFILGKLRCNIVFLRKYLFYSIFSLWWNARKSSSTLKVLSFNRRTGVNHNGITSTTVLLGLTKSSHNQVGQLIMHSQWNDSNTPTSENFTLVDSWLIEHTLPILLIRINKKNRYIALPEIFTSVKLFEKYSQCILNKIFRIFSVKMTYREKFIIQDWLEEIIPSENAYVQVQWHCSTITVWRKSSTKLCTKEI